MNVVFDPAMQGFVIESIPAILVSLLCCKSRWRRATWRWCGDCGLRSHFTLVSEFERCRLNCRTLIPCHILLLVQRQTPWLGITLQSTLYISNTGFLSLESFQMPVTLSKGQAHLNNSAPIEQREYLSADLVTSFHCNLPTLWCMVSANLIVLLFKSSWTPQKLIAQTPVTCLVMDLTLRSSYIHNQGNRFAKGKSKSRPNSGGRNGRPRGS